MIRRLVRAFLGELGGAPVEFGMEFGMEFGPIAVLSAREAMETDGERERSSGIREVDMTDDGREEPPSLTPPPRTVTLPPS